MAVVSVGPVVSFGFIVAVASVGPVLAVVSACGNCSSCCFWHVGPVVAVISVGAAEAVVYL